MKCTNCGFELEEQSKFCTNCGTQVEAIEPTYISTNADKILSALKDNMFLAICILYSIGTAISLFGDSLPVINILITIFLWLTYAKSLKNIADASHLRCISGCVYANYVIFNVVSIIFMVIGVLFFIFGLFSSSADFINSFVSNPNAFSFSIGGIEKPFTAASGWLVGIGFVFVGAILLVFNLLCTRKIHRFAKSVYMSVSDPCTELKNPKEVTNCFTFLAVCSGIAALSSLLQSVFAAISTGLSTALFIIIIILINKYFIKTNAQ